MNEFLQEVDIPLCYSVIVLTYQQTELLDQYTLTNPVSSEPASELSEPQANEIGIRQTSFTWANEETDGDATPNRRRFTLQIDDEVFFKHGCINLVIGQTGTGKTSLLMALLGETSILTLWRRIDFSTKGRCIESLMVLIPWLAFLDKAALHIMRRNLGF